MKKIIRLIFLGIYEPNCNQTSKVIRNIFVIFAVVVSIVFSFIPEYSIGFIESFLTIVSILFPLTLGFLTFGIDKLKDLSNTLSQYQIKNNSGVGPPISIMEEEKTSNQQDNAKHFIHLINSTGVISVVLLTIFIILKQFPHLLTSDSNISDICSIDFYKSITPVIGLTLFTKFITNLLLIQLFKNCCLFLNYLTKSAKEQIQS